MSVMNGQSVWRVAIVKKIKRKDRTRSVPRLTVSKVINGREAVTQSKAVRKGNYCGSCPIGLHVLRVQNEQFSEEKGFILRDTEKEVQFPPGFEPPIHGLRSELSTTELFDLPMNGHKSSVYQVPDSLFTNQSCLRCHKMTNCEQFRTKCCVKIAATLTLAAIDVFLKCTYQECYNRRESRVF